MLDATKKMDNSFLQKSSLESQMFILFLTNLFHQADASTVLWSHRLSKHEDRTGLDLYIETPETKLYIQLPSNNTVFQEEERASV